jgi:hypothetical protein
VITPNSVSSAAPATAGESCSTLSPAIVIEVCPATDSVQTGSSATFAATLANTTNTAVTWEVNGDAGGSPAYGTITSAGVYTAPATLPSPATVTISALSQAEGMPAGTAPVTLTAPPSSGGGGGGGGLEWLTLLAAGGRTLKSRRRGYEPLAARAGCARRLRHRGVSAPGSHVVDGLLVGVNRLIQVMDGAIAQAPRHGVVFLARDVRVHLAQDLQ